MTVARALTIAGSDSGGGAGIQADLKTFAAHGVYGLSAITAITAQNTVEVTDVLVLEPELVVAQIDAVLDDLGADAIKIGRLGSAVIVDAVAHRLRDVTVPVVVDPVMVSKGGAVLLDDEAARALRDEMLPLAALVTPNLPELAALTGMPVETRRERSAAIGALGVGALRFSSRVDTSGRIPWRTCWRRAARSIRSATPGCGHDTPTARAAPCRRRSRPGWRAASNS